MPDPAKNARGEARRLRKAVKRRRTYANNLRDTANEMARNGEDAEFSRKLHMLADSELAIAREQEAAAKALDETVRVQTTTHFSSAQSQLRAENAMKAMQGRFAIDRVQRLTARLGLEDPAPGALAAAMEKVEDALGITRDDGVPLMGQRIERAEKAAHADITS
jgi:hypothetical protein